MKLLLDTRAFLWLVEGDSRLSASAKTAIADPNNELSLSVASVWEMAIKIGNRKLVLSSPLDDYISNWTVTYQIGLLPVVTRHPIAVLGLPNPHRDPFDRMIIAQALVEGMTVISADPNFSLYPAPILW